VSHPLEEYVPRVYRFARRLTGDAHAAEDLTQETFLRAWRQRHRLRDPHAVRVWLFTIAANLWRDQLRRGHCRVAQAGSLTEEPPGPASPPDLQAVRQEEMRQVLCAMDALPLRQREALYLSACEGLSAAEVAGVLGTRADAVKANLSLARQKLRHQLRDIFEDLTCRRFRTP
jgi:RNA polymerase sigma-70 factor (ECF subfamily)